MAARKLWFGLLLVLAAAMLASVACGSSSSTVVSAEARSDKPRVTTPAVPADDITQAVQGNNAFAFDLYHQLLKSETGNVIFSPYSISTALAMTYAGARSETEAQIASTLHFLGQDKQHAALNAIDLAMAQAARQQPSEGGAPLQLEVANSLWGQRDFAFAPAFLDTLALYYGAGLRLTDFAANPEGARQAINDWVKQQTKERIPELFPRGIIDSQTQLVLANAIYFKAGWLFPFDAAGTKDGAFHRLRGSDVRAPMMSLNMKQMYAKLDHAQAVQLMYAGGDASMLLIVPDEGEFASFEAGLDASVVDAAVRSLQEAQVDLSMPKLDFASEFSLSEALKTLGMPSAFDGQADFSGMTARGGGGLYIKDVVHKANITVDEQGTTAAAATGVAIAESAPSLQVALKIDRPFMFIIRDNKTGLALFAGRVLDPTAS